MTKTMTPEKLLEKVRKEMRRVGGGYFDLQTHMYGHWSNPGIVRLLWNDGDNPADGQPEWVTSAIAGDDTWDYYDAAKLLPLLQSLPKGEPAGRYGCYGSRGETAYGAEPRSVLDAITPASIPEPDEE